ncbi:hypothetical protein DENIT_110163 [Pseudomonas veronii]|nr:hypothetical protein DENIT_110163 [Pseudomonas veronii]
MKGRREGASSGLLSGRGDWILAGFALLAVSLFPVGLKRIHILACILLFIIRVGLLNNSVEMIIQSDEDS